jgi:hypothetical protein
MHKYSRFYISNIIRDHTNCKIIAHISPEIIKVIASAPVTDHKEKHIHEYLNNNISFDLTLSFNEKIVFVYDEFLTIEIFTAIHTWFSKQSCNIENIVFITTHTTGLTEWYRKYSELHATEGFKIVEAVWLSLILWNETRLETFTMPPADIIFKDIKYYFSYYGGTRTSPEQDVLTSLVCTRADYGCIEYLGGFGSTMDKFDSYLEQLTNFKDRAIIDQLIDIRNNTILTARDDSIWCEDFTYTGAQWQIDKQSACQIIRETVTNIPFNIVTEKTFRVFLHFQIPLPLSGLNSVEQLEKLGFKFCHDLIDYSYQYEPNFVKRVSGALKQIDKLVNKYSTNDLREYIIKNKDIFWHNYNNITSLSMFDSIKETVIRELND